MIKVLVLLGLTLGLFSLVQAETITIPIKVPVGQQSTEYENLARPQRGMSKTAVLATFGEPLSQSQARGTPPISHWKYQAFTVYFESDYVIHSVLTHVKQD